MNKKKNIDPILKEILYEISQLLKKLNTEIHKLTKILN